jgi:hypothetical protein
MGYAFLPSAAGNVFGSLFGGVLFDKIAVDLEMPSLFWAIYVSIGLISIGNFLLYNKWISTKLGTYETKRNFFNSRLSYAGIYSLIAVMILSGISAGTTSYLGDDEEGEEGEGRPLFEISETIAFSEYIADGDFMEFPISVNVPNVIHFNVSLTWMDEPDTRRIIRTYENNPDTFRVSVDMENITTMSESGSNIHGQPGSLEINLAFEGKPVFFNNTGTYSILVELLEAGDQFPGVGLIGFTDAGNDFDLVIEYTYLSDTESGGGIIEEEPE